MSEKTKILFLITKANFGGAQRYVYDLATHLSDDEFEIVVAMGEGSLLGKKLSAIGVRTIQIASLRESGSAFPRIADVFAVFALIRLVRKERPNILHLNSSRASFLGALASRLVSFNSFLPHILNAKRYPLNASRIIFTAHGWPFKEPRPLLTKLVVWIASYATALLSDQVIVLSDDDEKSTNRMPCVATKTVRIANGVEPIISLSREEARERLTKGLPKDRLIIGAIAELNRNKGLYTLIEAAALLPNNLTFCVIGEGEERKRLEALASFKGVATRVLLPGFIENASSYLSAFDIFVLPSLKEGLPYALLEAGIHGLPSVGSNIPGIRDIISNPELGILVSPNDPVALSRALTELINNKEKRAGLGKAFATHIAKNFSLQQMIQKTRFLYLQN